MRLALAVILLFAASCVPVAESSRASMDRSAPLRGKLVFEEHCAACHPGGNGGVGPSLDRPFSHAVLHAQVRLGNGVMPAFDEETIGDRDFEALAEYLRALRAARLARR